MRWWPFSRGGGDGAAAAVSSSSSSSVDSSESPKIASSSVFRQQLSSWTDSVSKADWKQLAEPQTWLPPTLAVAAALGFSAFYRSYLRRIPTTNHIQPRFFRRRSLLGRVTSVGDGDNFHLYHTPGGRLAGWGWLRRVPTYRKELKGQTIPVRLAGIDAPECAHFGRPAQPYSGEALDFLTQYILGRRVRAYLFRRDQYDRVVARVMVRRFFFFRRDVGYEMIKRGLATCYEAKTGSEFGGREAQYRVAEVKAKARKRGLWSGGSSKGDVETPREYKNRMATEDAEKSQGSVKLDASTSAKTVAAKTAASTAVAVAAKTASAHSSPVVATAGKPTPTPIPAATVTVAPKPAPETLATVIPGKSQTTSSPQTPKPILPAVGGGPLPARITTATAKQ